MTESTDAIALIVSEETGIISMAQGGKLTRHLDADGLARVLSGMYRRNDETLKQLFDALVNRIRSWRVRKDDKQT